MASGDTKTQEYLDLAATGTRADLPAARGCCNTRTQDLIVDVADRIITEEETRAREDAILQGEIDEIKNNPDVYDIVPTYAALQAYDTSGLTDKDVIRVLADETHSGASTYYRWSTSTQSFTYVGEAGDYYTKSQMDTLLDAKQDELTAGDNITIEDESGALVISATDTTYSNFTGTDGTAAGAAGLVPAPATTDAGKFLKADGTWDTAGGGGSQYNTYSTKTTSDGATGGAIYLGNLGANQTQVADPTTTDSHYKYFWALPKNNTSTPAKNSINIGGTTSSGISLESCILGFNAEVSGISNVGYAAILGNSAKTTAQRGTAIGYQATAGLGGSSLGYNAGVLPTGVNTAGTGEVCIGAYSTCTGVDGVVSFNATNTSYGYSGSNYRLLTGLYDGQNAHDAATYGQVVSYSAINGAGAPTTATEGKYVGQLYYDTANEAMYFLKTIDTATTPATYTWEALGGGSSYTAGNGIDITNDVISATNTGKARALTTDDYNWPTTGTKTTVALWLMDNGIYTNPNEVSVSTSSSYSSTSKNGMYLVYECSGQKEIITLEYSAGNTRWELLNATTGVSMVSRPLPVGLDNNLTSTSDLRALTSNQGRVLKGLIDSITISGSGAPTTSTAGAVGQLYRDTTNGKLYICTDATNPYVWEEVGAGGGSTYNVYSTKTTSNKNAGGAIYLGNLNSSQEQQLDPTTTDNHYRYFCALPKDNNTIPTEDSINIMGDFSPYSNVSNIISLMGANSPQASNTISIGSSYSNSGNSVGVGFKSQVLSNCDGAVAIGQEARVPNDCKGSVALGYKAQTTRAGELNIGSTSSAYGFNSTKYRVIGGVHDGQSAHDAATVAQGNTLAASAPTTATVGVLGQLYTDTTNMHTYQCTAIDDVTDPSNPVYTWTQRW